MLTLPDAPRGGSRSYRRDLGSWPSPAQRAFAGYILKPLPPQWSSTSAPTPRCAGPGSCVPSRRTAGPDATTSPRHHRPLDVPAADLRACLRRPRTSDQSLSAARTPDLRAMPAGRHRAEVGVRQRQRLVGGARSPADRHRRSAAGTSRRRWSAWRRGRARTAGPGDVRARCGDTESQRISALVPKSTNHCGGRGLRMYGAPAKARWARPGTARSPAPAVAAASRPRRVGRARGLMPGR